MKCPTCESCEYEQYCGATEIMRKCDRHNRKVEQTNEEWIKSLDTEQLAEWLQEHMDCAICGCNKDLCYKGYDCCKLAFVEWLKQPHTPKE